MSYLIEVATVSYAAPIVFVVDDDVSVRESLELLIESAGWQAHTFASAQEFLAHPPDPAAPSCLVLDVNLPDVTGLELQQSLALDRNDMPVILISGHDAGEAMDRAMKAGAVAFLTKPLDADALLHAIEHAIGRSRATLGRKREV
jgi:FixJ family two-component response regulator